MADTTKAESIEAQAGSAQVPSSPHEAGAGEDRPLERHIVTIFEKVVRSVGSGARRCSEAFRERSRAQGSTGPAGEGASTAPEHSALGLRMPEEVRGLVERYPWQALVASWGAGYVVGAVMGGRRR